ncbi:MAG: MinD/ParA family protein [Clostridia bacterium]|nr:MinD/ParA family protein [Clostridia bacterium]
MKSQAEMFRERVEQADRTRTEGPRRARTFCVTSGKGGVGKTSFSVNFGISLAQWGKKVVVIDGDFGFSNVNLMLGNNSPYTLEHVIRGEKRLHEIMSESYPNLWYISGGSGVRELIELDEGKLDGVLSQLAPLEAQMDFIIFDTGAGMNANILRMIDAADTTVLVTTPEPTSVLDSYVVLKSSADLENRPHVEVLINKANNAREVQNTYTSLASVADRNLGWHVDMLGHIPLDDRITKSIKDMTPYMIQYPLSSLSQQMKRIAQSVAMPREEPAPSQKSGVRGFFQRLLQRRGS